jgi:hypothetical protein
MAFSRPPLLYQYNRLIIRGSSILHGASSGTYWMKDLTGKAFPQSLLLIVVGQSGDE